ncbi:hypothetical protein KP626_09340 [Christensenella sp. MSJ-20]|uniref:hypothetical protein n=1 Tax=Christensenella sp. MSJ-20 TaxID=2841518 RepID=UPI001C790976|nr:hypothetical protein KP626_09340 [Christensenella sp. MSJ-20]
MKWRWNRKAEESQAIDGEAVTASESLANHQNCSEMAGVDGEEAPSCASEPMDDSVPEETLEAAEESECDELDLLLSGPEEPEEEESQEEILARRQRAYSAVAYFGPIGAVVALVYGVKNRLVRFHGLQSMALWILVIAAAILAGGTNLFVLMTNLITPIEQLLLGTAIYLVFMAIFVALTYCVLGAITEVPSCLPLIGAPLLALSGLEQEDSMEGDAGTPQDLDVPYFTGEGESRPKRGGIAAFFGKLHRKPASQDTAPEDMEGAISPKEENTNSLFAEEPQEPHVEKEDFLLPPKPAVKGPEEPAEGPEGAVAPSEEVLGETDLEPTASDVDAEVLEEQPMDPIILEEGQEESPERQTDA